MPRTTNVSYNPDTKRYTYDCWMDIRVDDVNPREGSKGFYEGGVIGGDKGDFHFSGWYRDEQENCVFFEDSQFVTTIPDLEDEEVLDMAYDVIMQAHASIGDDIFR